MKRGGWLALAIAAAACALALPAAAKKKDDEKEQSRYTVSSKIGKKLTEVTELIQAERHAEAVALLDTFELDRLDPYPKALVHQAYAIVEVGRDDFPAAAGHFQTAVELEALPPSQQLSMRFNLGQIYLMLDRWEEAITTFEKWFAETESPSSIAYYMLALAYYQSGDQAGALAPAAKAVELSDDPKESWLQLLLSLHMVERRYPEALPLLERLALRYPKKLYWTQLGGVLMELEREEDSLAAQQLAYATDMLTESRELVRLSQSLVVQGIPWQGALVMRRGLERETIESDAASWRLLASTLLAARENQQALEPLARAAELAEDGQGYLQLGQVLLQAERWEEALGAFEKALGRGGLERPAQAHLGAGVAAYQQKRLSRARSELARALSDDTVGTFARQWLDFVAREEARVAEDGAG